MKRNSFSVGEIRRIHTDVNFRLKCGNFLLGCCWGNKGHCTRLGTYCCKEEKEQKDFVSVVMLISI